MKGKYEKKIYKNVRKPRNTPVLWKDEYSIDSREGRYEGDLILERDAQVTLVRPRYDGGPLVFRPLPALDPETLGALLPFRIAGSQSGFMRDFSGVRGLGEPGKGSIRYSFVLFNPVTDPTYNQRTNPYNILYWTVYNAVKNNNPPRFPGVRESEWNKYVEGREAVLPRSQTLYFIQALVYINDQKNYHVDGAPLGLAVDDHIPMVMLPYSVGRTLKEMFSEFAEGYDSTYEGPDWESAMAYGDPVAPEHGRFITVARKGTLSSKRTRSRMSQDSGAGSIGYEVSIDKELVVAGYKHDVSPALSEDDMDEVASKLQWFDDVIHVPTHEEICEYCARALANLPHILEFGWADHPEFFTAEVKRILAKSAQVRIARDVPYERTAQTGRPSSLSEATTRRQSAPPAEPEPEMEEEPAVPRRTTGQNGGVVSRILSGQHAPKLYSEDEEEDEPTQPVASAQQGEALLWDDGDDEDEASVEEESVEPTADEVAEAEKEVEMVHKTPFRRGNRR